VGALHRAGPQLRHLNLEILAAVGDGAAALQASDDVDRVLHALAAVVATQPMADKFVLVVNRALADSDIDPAPGQIVEQRQLDGEPYRGWKGSCTTAKPIRILSVRIATVEANSCASL